MPKGNDKSVIAKATKGSNAKKTGKRPRRSRNTGLKMKQQKLKTEAKRLRGKVSRVMRRFTAGKSMRGTARMIRRHPDMRPACPDMSSAGAHAQRLDAAADAVRRKVLDAIIGKKSSGLSLVVEQPVGE